jgi:hypothetical protein
MPHGYNLREHQTVSNSGSVYPDSIAADLGIRIVVPRQNEGEFDFTLFGPVITSPDRNLHGVSRRPPSEIFALVDECRSVWKSAVVDFQRKVDVEGKAKFEFSFQEQWNFKNEANFHQNAAPRLAKAGENLFASIFEIKCDDGLREIGQALRTLSLKDRYIAITSNSFFLPWGMLYTHPIEGATLKADGSNWEKKGFWGYRHIVQQTPEKYKLENGIQTNAAGEVTLSINFDDRLSGTMNLPSVDEHIQFLGQLGAKIKRTRKSELEIVFTENRCNLERILYFYCHGHGSSNAESSLSLKPPHLELTDDTVTALDFERWAKGERLPTSPLMFINACQGGQMTTLFYKSFAVELLKEGAVGLIGAQIDVPAVFGAEYAKQMFSGFLARNKTGKVRLGPLLRRINRTMWDRHKNPLGLVYSLYRGVDCFIDWPKQLAG